MADGALPELLPAEPGGSLVTATSALHQQNMPRLLRRLHAAVGAAKESAERELEKASAVATAREEEEYEEA